ncbi:unnamed protein product, partial [Protopolystoma xenopodis]
MTDLKSSCSQTDEYLRMATGHSRRKKRWGGHRSVGVQAGLSKFHTDGRAGQDIKGTSVQRQSHAVVGLTGMASDTHTRIAASKHTSSGGRVVGCSGGRAVGLLK